VVELLTAVVASPTTVGEVKREAIMNLWGVSAPSPADAFASVLGNSLQEVRLTAAAALLRVGDLRGLQAAEDALLNRAIAETELGHNLSVAIRDGVSDAAAVPTLSRMLEHGDADTRKAATTALGRTQSEMALSPLVGALGDVERDVRYRAVVGLADLTRTPEWRPTTIAFVEDEARYLQYWKAWARTR
jgi:HEAT repeat protein